MLAEYVSRKRNRVNASVGRSLRHIASVVFLIISITAVRNVWAVGVCDVVKNGLVACYPFDGNANDGSGNNNNGIVNGVSLADDRFGKPNSSYEFNGNNHVRVPDAPSQQIATNQISLSAWITLERNVENTQWRVVNKQQSAGISWGLEIFGNGYSSGLGNNIAFHNSNGSTWANCVVSEISLVPKVTYHVAVVAESNVAKIYLDSKWVKTCQNMLGIPQIISADLAIGATSSTHFFFEGQIDDISVYNRSLTEQEILTLYNFKDQPPKSCDHATYSVANNQGKLTVPFVDVPLLDQVTHLPTGELAVFKAELKQLGGLDLDFGLVSSKLKLIFLTPAHDPCHAIYDETQKTLHLPFVDINSQVYDAVLQHLQTIPLDLGVFHLQHYQLVQ